MFNQKEYQKEWYIQNRDSVLERSRKRYVKHQPEIAKQKVAYVQARSEEFRFWKGFAGPCVKCGIGDSRVLQFHHISRKGKNFEVNCGSWYSESLNALIEEISKCVILCGNCHAVEEFENGYWKSGRAN